MSRAYTYIDRSVALLGNRWMERQWSPLVGATVALIDKADRFDWINGSCVELGFNINGELLEPVQLGAATWVEDNGQLGATLTCMRELPRLEVHVSTFAYHERPVMLRTVRVLNKSGQPLPLHRAILDSFAMARKTFRALIHGFREAHDRIVYDSQERAVALQLKNRGLILGAEAYVRYELRDPDPACCAVCVNASDVLAPGRWYEFPCVYIIPYQGPVADASRTHFADFLAHRRELSEDEQERTTRD